MALFYFIQKPSMALKIPLKEDMTAFSPLKISVFLNFENTKTIVLVCIIKKLWDKQQRHSGTGLF